MLPEIRFEVIKYLYELTLPGFLWRGQAAQTTETCLPIQRKIEKKTRDNLLQF